MKKKLVIKTPEDLLDPEHAKLYFEKHRMELFGRRDLHIKKVTPWTLRARHLVVFFDVIAGEPKVWKRAVGLADDGNERILEHERLQALINQNLSEKYFATPKPIFLDQKLGMSFITHVPGNTLADVARNKRTISAPILRNVARWLKNLQSIPQKNIPHLAPHPQIRWAKLDVKKTKQIAPEFYPLILRAWTKWEARWNKELSTLDMVLAHGDFHPLNIKQLPKTNDISVIDFGLLCWAPKFWDLASFLVQTDAIHGRYLKPNEVMAIQRGMLSAWESEMGKLTLKDKKQLKWLKQFFRLGTVAYLFSRDPYPHIKRLFNQINK